MCVYICGVMCVCAGAWTQWEAEVKMLKSELKEKEVQVDEAERKAKERKSEEKKGDRSCRDLSWILV